MQNPNVKDSNLHSSVRWWEISEGFTFNVKILEMVKGKGMFDSDLRNLAFLAPSPMRPRLLKKVV